MNNTTVEVSETDHSGLDVTGYRLAHGYVSGTLCFVGIVFNICNAIVWSRRNMRTSTNLLLTILSVADGISVFMYFLYVTYYFTATGPSELIYHSKAGMYLVVVCFHQFIAFHTLSNWITISLAIFRYLKVCHPNLGKKICTKKRARLTIGIVFIATNLATIPFYLYYEVFDMAENGGNFTGFWIRKTTFAVTHVDYQTTLAWVYGVVFKVGPSVSMCFLCALMIRELRQADNRRANMSTTRSNETRRIPSGYYRTTVMLVVVVLIYVLTELPIGIVSFVSGLRYTESHFFYFLLYSYVGDLLDTLTVINGTVNLVVYYTMSRQYRIEFKITILGKFFKRFADFETTGVSSTDNTKNLELSKSSEDILSRDKRRNENLESMEMTENEKSAMFSHIDV